MYWISVVTLFCFWPIVLLFNPIDFVRAFIFNKPCGLNYLLFRLGRFYGFTVGIVAHLFK